MSYTLNYGPGGNIPLTIQDSQSGTIGNLTFPGRNFSGYGSPVDQNFLSLNENFASANYQGPQYPIPGQLWFDIANATAGGGNVSYRGLKINTGLVSGGSLSNVATIDANVANWSMLVTYDWANAATTPTNPKNISGIGTISATNATITGNVAIANLAVADLAVSNLANINSAYFGNSSNHVTIGNTGIALTGSSSNITGGNATFTGAVGTGALTISGAITQTNAGAPVSFAGDVTVGNLVVNGSTTSANTGTLNVANAAIEVGTFSGSVANTGKDVGTVYHYAVGTTDTSAYMGFQNSTGNFILAKNITMNPNGVATVNSYGNMTLAGINATTVTATTFVGTFANGTTSVGLPTINGNINLTATGNLIANVTGTSMSIVKTTAATSTSTGALTVAGGVGIGGDLYVNGNIVGKISSTGPASGPSATYTGNVSGAWQVATIGVQTPLVQATTANVSGNVNAGNVDATGGTVTATNGVFSSLTTTSSVNAPGVYTTNLYATGGTPTSGGVITGAWTLNGTLEATYAADLAERHHSDAVYPVGTVMTVGGTNEVTAANLDSIILGVVSEDWAYLMNGGAGSNDTHPGIAYVGRVPVRVVGPINKHDRVGPIEGGLAVASAENSFGWALETNLDPAEKLVLCIVK